MNNNFTDIFNTPDDIDIKKGEGRIIQGDVIEVLQKQNQKFDLIIADPPYNINKNFGNNDDNLDINEYVDWCNKWLTECFRLLKDDGLMYVYGFHEILAKISVNYDINKQRWLAWHYTNKTVPSLNFWQRSHEAILCLWNERRPDILIDQIREPYTEQYVKLIGRKRTNVKGRFGDKTTVFADHGGTLPKDVISVPSLSGGAGQTERWFLCRDCDDIYSPKELSRHAEHDILKHPTQKPMKLTEKLILSKTKKGTGKVLIPFAGSGSECIVAQSLGIDYLGIEINPEFVKLGMGWLMKKI